MVLEHSEEVLPSICEFTQRYQPDSQYNSMTKEEQYSWGRNALRLFAEAMEDPSECVVPQGSSSSLDIVVRPKDHLLGPVVTAVNWLFIVQQFAPYVQEEFCTSPRECDLASDHFFNVAETLISGTMRVTEMRILQALNSVHQGMSVLAAPDLQDGTVQGNAEPTQTLGLSPRELDVLRLVALGKSNGEIAQALDISQNTVRNHVSRLLSKLGFASRSQLAVYATSSGIASM